MLQVCAKRAIAMVIFSRIGMAMPAMGEGVMCCPDCVLQCLLQQQVYSMLRNVMCIIIWHVKSSVRPSSVVVVVVFDVVVVVVVVVVGLQCSLQWSCIVWLEGPISSR